MSPREDPYAAAVSPSASTPLCAVILAAGVGARLRPLTDIRPKALCPVGNVPLLDRALDSVRPYAADVAVAAPTRHGRFGGITASSCTMGAGA